MKPALLLAISLLCCCCCFAQWADDALTRHKTVNNLPKDAIRVFPNPVVNDVYITVKTDSITIRTVFLYDKDGNRVLEQKVNSNLSVPVKLTMGKLSQGTYYLVIETNRQPFRMLLIKQ